MALTPEELDARLKNVETGVQNLTDANAAMDGRVKVLEADDAKVHGIITKVGGLIADNPWISTIVTTLGSAFLMWLAASMGIVPGLPPGRPAYTPPANSAPSESPTIDQIRKNVKENK